MQIDSQRKELTTLSEINVTPFVDVMLVLLIIFMVTAPMMLQGIDVNLPKAESKPIEIKEEELILTIAGGNKIFLNKQLISLHKLGPKLKELIQYRGNKDLYLKADQKIPYGFVIKVMAEAKKSGVERLGMITEEEKEVDSPVRK